MISILQKLREVADRAEGLLSDYENVKRNFCPGISNGSDYRDDINQIRKEYRQDVLEISRLADQLMGIHKDAEI